jgi:MYXO-CTERM domain-containing protein
MNSLTHKKPRLIGLIVLPFAGVSSLYAGPFAGSDNFNDNTLSPVLWASPATSGQASVSESGGKLNITSVSTGGGSANVNFVGTPGTFDSDWVVQAEFTNVIAGLTYATEIGFELRGGSGSVLNYGLKRFSGDSATPQLATMFGPGGSLVEAYGSAGGIGIDTLALQLSYTASTGLLRLDYDGNFSAPGHAWTTFRTYGLANTGGNARGDFGLNGNESFGLSIYATILEDAVPAGILAVDNFQTTAVPEPSSSAIGLGFIGLAHAVLHRRRRPRV